MIVLDASVLIALLDNDDTHHQSAMQLLATDAGSTLSTPTLTWAEALVGPCRRGEGPAANEVLRRLEVRELPPPRPLELATLRSTSRLAMPDVVVLQAALDHGGTLATFDERLARGARELRVPTLP